MAGRSRGIWLPSRACVICCADVASRASDAGRRRNWSQRLQGLGARRRSRWSSCDVSDRAAVGAVLRAIAPDRPLTGVFHLAALLDDGIVPALTAERLERVLRPKLDGACHLHELTADLDLAAFVLFSSVAALGSPGQANYAAANVFLDALAAERRHRGLAGQSLMWGLWEQQGAGMTAHLGRAELLRLRRQGVQALSLELGLALLDAAQSLQNGKRSSIPIRLDLGVMQRQFAEDVPALYRGLLRSGLKRASASSGDTNALRARLGVRCARAMSGAAGCAGGAGAGRDCGGAGAAREPSSRLLRMCSAQGAGAGFADGGLNCATACSGGSATKLPTTLAFDYPTARAMARLLLEKQKLGRDPVRPSTAASDRAHRRRKVGAHRDCAG